MTLVSIPNGVLIIDVPEHVLIPGWDLPIPMRATEEYGGDWIANGFSAVHYVLNVRHPDFREINFGPSEPFHFDPRLTQ